MTQQRWFNLGLQLLIFVSMAALALIDAKAYVVVVSVSLVALPPVCWTVAGVLTWTSNQDPTIRSLSDAADNAITTAINSTLLAVVGGLLLARLAGFVCEPIGDVLTILLGFIVVNASALPSFRFLRTWRLVWSKRVWPDRSPLELHRDPDDAAREGGEG